MKGQCCDEHIQTACKVEETIYKVGTSWPSPDGNKCKNFTCVKKDNKLSKQESIETCKTKCSKVPVELISIIYCIIPDLLLF